MIRNVIFDMDGVIIDSETLYINKLEEILTENNIKISKFELDKFIGLSNSQTYKKIKEYLPKLSIDEFNEKYVNYFRYDKICYQDILDKNIIELCEYLVSNNYTLVIASSSPKYTILKMLEICKLNEYFSFIISGEEFKESKPNPEIYIYTLKILDSNNMNSIVIEDSEYGIEAAKEAGLRVIAKVPSEYNVNQMNADYFIKNLLEIKDIIIKLNKNSC